MPRLPQPPLRMENKSLHRSLTDVINYLHETFDNGAQHPAFTQDQIDNFKDKSYLGTVVFNSTTNESNVSFLDGSDVKWRTF